MVGRQLPFFSLLVPFWLIWAFAGWRGMKEIWPAILVTGVSFAVPQFLISNYHGPWLVDVGAAIISMACLTLFLRVWKPKTIWRTTALKGNQQEGAAAPGRSSMQVEKHDRATVIRAWVPWIVLSVFVFLWGIPQVKTLLNGGDAKAKIEYAWNGVTKIDIPVPGLNDMVQKVPPVVAKPSTEKAVYSLNWLSATGSGILLAALIAGFYMRYSFRDLLRKYWETIVLVRYSLLTIAAMLAIGFTTRYSGTDATMGLAFAHTGALYPFFGTLLGWLGVALTGSDTASNVLFGGLQKITSEQLGLNPNLMAAANSSGGVMGKMIDAQRTQQVTMDTPLCGEATVDLLGEEPLAAAQPSLGLHEIEEEHPRELQQHKAATAAHRAEAWELRRHPLERGPELTKEPGPGLLGRQSIGHPRGVRESASLARSGETAESRECRAGGAVEPHGQNRRAVERHRQSHPPRHRIECDDAPCSPPGGEPPGHRPRGTLWLATLQREPRKAPRLPDHQGLHCALPSAETGDGIAERLVAEGGEQGGEIFQHPDISKDTIQFHSRGSRNSDAHSVTAAPAPEATIFTREVSPHILYPMNRHLSITLVLATGLAPVRMYAQTVADSGTFIVRHLNDTVATEQFARTATTIEGTLALRNAAATSQRYTAVLAPDGSVPLIELTVREDEDSGRVKAKIVNRARVVFKEDSAAVDQANNTGIKTYVFGTRRGAIPYLNLSFALLEQAVRQARSPTAASEVPLFNLGGGQTVEGKVTALGADSLSLAIGSVEYHLKVDPGGRLLGARIPAQNLVVDRVGGS